MSMYFDHCVNVEVECYTRRLLVCWNEQNEIASEDTVRRILENRYEKWVSPEDYPDEYEEIVYACCEQYMLAGLDEIGLKYETIYVRN